MSIAKLPVAELRVGNYTVCVKNRLAEGGFGYVDLVYEASSRAEYVLKRCGIERPEMYEIVKKEISILQRFAGPHLVKLLASEVITLAKGKREACLLLELCPGGHLLERLCGREGKHLPPASLYRIFGQLLLALKPMHESEPPITHRDLKLENILFGSDGNVRLCDFGSCVIGHVPLRNVEERAAAEEIIGKETTQIYRSPEMIDLYMRDVLTEKSDIWALGCILYTMCYLLHPFQDQGSLGILSAKIKFPDAPVAQDIKTVIMRMLDVDPEARPSIAQLLQTFAAIATGKPLPHYEVPREAILRKEEREITAKKREEKNKNALKKAAPKIVPQKSTAPLDSNSVAARRLAMKKGTVEPIVLLPTQTPTQTQIPIHTQPASSSTNSSEALFETNFGSLDVGSGSGVKTPTAGTATSSPVTRVASNGWGDIVEPLSSPSSSSAFGNPWGAESTDSHKSAELFDAFNDSPAILPKKSPPPLPPKPKPRVQSSPPSILLELTDPEDLNSKGVALSRKSSHDTVGSVTPAAGAVSDAFTSGRSSTDSDIGFSAFGNSPKNNHSASAAFAFDSASSLFASTPATPARPLSARKVHKVDSASVDLLDYPSPPSSHAFSSSVKPHPVLPLPIPASAPRGASVPTLLPSYELDLFDTIIGPPVLDFLSMDNAMPSKSATSSYVSRQQADDVLSLFDQGSSQCMTTPAVNRSACPDLTRSLYASASSDSIGMRNQGLGMSPQIMQQQQRQMQQDTRPLSFPHQPQRRLPQDNPSQRPMSNNYQNSPVSGSPR